MAATMLIVDDMRPWPGVFLLAMLVLAVRYTSSLKVGSSLISCPEFQSPSPLVGIFYLIRGPQIIENAYKKAQGNAFTITTPSNNHLLITSPELIRELVDAPLDRLSLHAVAKELLQPRYTMYGFEWQDQRGVEGTGFVRALRSLLTAHLPALQPNFERILQTTLSTELGRLDRDGFSRVKIFPMVKRTVTNVNCFVFFGEELCNNATFVEAALEFPQAVIFAAEFLRITPGFLRPFVAAVATKRHRAARTISQYLEPVVAKRLQMRDGPCREDSPAQVDCVQWLIDTSPRKTQWSTERMVGEIMAVWFGSVHQLAMTATYAIEDLCIHDECIEPLQAEIAAARASCGGDGRLDVEARLPLLDSFLRESIRCTNSDAVTVRRKALKPYTFSDGISSLAAGDWVCVPQRAMMNDATHYNSPHVFDAFRFLPTNQRLRDRDTPSSLTTASIGWPIWGLGKTACPGRFYASMIAKLLLVNVLEEWTCRLEDPRVSRTRVWRSSVVPRDDTIVAFKRSRSPS
ncbi:cytochrome P450 [Xylaria cubensis]|nr:cytochrome P450 [Xylaria cubensis]